jgi:hypothetical protein
MKINCCSWIFFFINHAVISVLSDFYLCLQIALSSDCAFYTDLFCATTATDSSLNYFLHYGIKTETGKLCRKEYGLLPERRKIYN